VVAGASAQSGAEIIDGTSTTPVVTINLDARDRALARVGEGVDVQLPGDQRVKGTIAAVGTVATTSGQGSSQTTTVPVTVTLADGGAASTLDGAAVTVSIAGETHQNVLTVPITALLAVPGGGYAVETADGGLRPRPGRPAGGPAGGRRGQSRGGAGGRRRGRPLSGHPGSPPVAGRGPAHRVIMRGVRWLVGLLLVAGVACQPAPAANVAIEVDHPVALADVPLHVRVSGLGGGQRVTVTADAHDSADRELLSFASFHADPRGVVDLASATPSRGTYAHPEAMGLFRSLVATDSNPPLFRPRPTQEISITVSDGGGRTLATRIVKRVYSAAGVTTRYLFVPQDGFFGHYYAPAVGAAPRPAVLLIGGAEGGLGAYLDVAAELLASHGFPALTIGYFGLQGLPGRLANLRLEYFMGALAWLRGQPGVDQAHLFAYGDSRGSEAALLLGAHRPDLVRGVVALVPSSVVHCSFPDCTGPSWTLDGVGLPYTSQFDGPDPTDDPGAVIPVERIAGPVMLVCGESDSVWPSCPYARAIDQRLTGHADPNPHLLLAYQGADHDVGWLAPDQPDTNLEGDALGKADAWPRLLALLGAA
jgi:dienelactone hydrolase